MNSALSSEATRRGSSTRSEHSHPPRPTPSTIHVFPHCIKYSMLHGCMCHLVVWPVCCGPPFCPHYGRCTVDEWMAHYRRFLGINPRTPSPLASSRTSLAFSPGPPSRLQSSRAQPRPQSHMRHKTHPLPGSRPVSQLSALSQSPPCSPSPDLGTSNVGLVYDRPSSRAK